MNLSAVISPELKLDQRRSTGRDRLKEAHRVLCVWSGKVAYTVPTGGIKDVHDSCSKDFKKTLEAVLSQVNIL